MFVPFIFYDLFDESFDRNKATNTVFIEFDVPGVVIPFLWSFHGNEAKNINLDE